MLNILAAVRNGGRLYPIDGKFVLARKPCTPPRSSDECLFRDEVLELLQMGLLVEDGFGGALRAGPILI